MILGFVRRWLGTIIALGVFALIALAGALYFSYTRLQIPATPPPLQTSEVVDVEGRPVGSFHATVDRTVVPLKDMSPWVISATLAAEDAGFYRHAGVDPLGILRAFITDVLAGSAVQGGSTITQQLVKNVYAGTYEADPETGEVVYVTPPRTVLQKVREALLALKLERELTKDQILARYLNTIYFGQGAYGVEAAARTYFGKSAAKLNAIQAAALAATIRSPGTRDPITDPEGIRDRRDYVLDRMVDEGALSEADAETLKAKPLKTRPATGGRGYDPTLGYFLDYLRRDLVQRYGEATLVGGGLEIATTLDLDVQRAAEQAVRTRLPGAEDPEAAIVAIDPATGAIRAMVGGRDFGKSEVNLATGQGGSGRQAGSAFKPFTLVAAMEARYSLESVWKGPARITIADPRCYTDGKPWTLSNASDEENGKFTLAKATWFSVNTIYAQLVSEVGPEAVVDVAERMGIRSPLDAYCSITLGTQAVNPLEMTTAYATLAATGTRSWPFGVTTVAGPNGKVLFTAEPEREQVLDANDVAMVTSALQGVISNGTGRAAGIGRPAAGKTGTAQDYADAWFCGYTPQLATCVWVGYPEGEIPLVDVQGVRAVYGGTIPALIWHDVMAAAMEGQPVLSFPAPATDQYTRSPATPVVTPSGSASPTPTASTTAPVPTPTDQPTPTPTPTSTPEPPTPTPSPTTATGGEATLRARWRMPLA